MDSTDLPPPTIPSSLPFTLNGFPNETVARAMGSTVMSWLREISGFIDAERLEGVTIAWNYDAALAALDRGVEGLAPLTRSTERGLGVAMAPAVMRNGEVRAHLVIHAGLAEALMDEAHQHYRMAVYTLAHEMAHIHDLKMQDRAMPGVILRPRTGDAFDGALLRIAEPCWNEYIACVLSAAFDKEQISLYEETFLPTLGKAKEETDREIMLYSTHCDMDRLMRSAVAWHGDLLKFAAYLIGHLHGIGGTLETAAPRAHAALQGSWFADVLAELEDALRKMGDVYPNWPGSQVYEPLKDVAWGALYAAGFVLQRMANDRLYVRIRQ